MGPERTRISYLTLLETTTYAALREESRTISTNATTLDRKSGGAERRDLQFSGPLVEMFFRQTDQVKDGNGTCSLELVS